MKVPTALRLPHYRLIVHTLLLIGLLLAHASAFHTSSFTTVRWHRSQTTAKYAAPEGALSDIVIPSIFNLTEWNNGEEDDPRVWVPQTDCLSFRPLCFCTSQGYYVNLLKFTGGGILGRHRHVSLVYYNKTGIIHVSILSSHIYLFLLGFLFFVQSSPVHAVTLIGSWGYR